MSAVTEQQERTRLRTLLAGALVVGVCVAALAVWLTPERDAWLVALLATVPFVVLARYAWARLRRLDARATPPGPETGER